MSKWLHSNRKQKGIKIEKMRQIGLFWFCYKLYSRFNKSALPWRTFIEVTSATLKCRPSARPAEYLSLQLSIICGKGNFYCFPEAASLIAATHKSWFSGFYEDSTLLTGSNELAKAAALKAGRCKALRRIFSVQNTRRFQIGTSDWVSSTILSQFVRPALKFNASEKFGPTSFQGLNNFLIWKLDRKLAHKSCGNTNGCSARQPRCWKDESAEKHRIKALQNKAVYCDSFNWKEAARKIQLKLR